MAKEVVLTREGFEKLKAEIEELPTVRRREVAERITEAREFGDISENSEYDDAKNEQAMLEAKIAQLEERLRDATVIDARRGLDRRRGARLDGHARDAGRQGDVPAGRLRRVRSATRTGSPTSRRSAARIIGHKKGETVDVVTPGGPIKVKIVSIKAA